MCIEKYLIDETFTIKQAIEKMEKELIKAVLIVNEHRQVQGLFSNGDMRKFFLRGGALSENISNAMNKTPRLYKSIEEKLIEFVENEYLNVSTSDSLSNKSNQ